MVGVACELLVYWFIFPPLCRRDSLDIHAVPSSRNGRITDRLEDTPSLIDNVAGDIIQLTALGLTC